MRTKNLTFAVSKRAGKGINQQHVSRVLSALLEEFSELLLQGDEVRLRGIGKLHMKFKRGKFRLHLETFPSFQDRIETDFVENKENEV
jgi:nucleoid DNA-binding protein